jgi:cytochrome bd ubiquinol oxidase subunit II
MTQNATLADLWFFLLAFVLWLYIITDGFDLGVGILSLFERDEDKTARMMRAIEPVWHANQTWLVILGGVLFGAFPHVYGAIFSALYLPAVFLLVFLICRGVALEYRPEAKNKRFFSLLFGLGSLGAALTQGFLLGAALQGMPIEDGVFTGGLFDWLTPFSLILAAALCAVYSMLGAVYLTMKSEGDLKISAVRCARLSALASAILILVLIAWTMRAPELERYAKSWFANGLTFSTWFMPVALSFIMFFKAIKRETYPMAFSWAAGAVLFLMAAFAGALYPFIIAPNMTVAKAAAAPESLRVMLYVIGPFLPVIFFYNIYQYVVFRGPVEPENH